MAVLHPLTIVKTQDEMALIKLNEWISNFFDKENYFPLIVSDGN